MTPRLLAHGRFGLRTLLPRRGAAASASYAVADAASLSHQLRGGLSLRMCAGRTRARSSYRGPLGPSADARPRTPLSDDRRAQLMAPVPPELAAAAPPIPAHFKKRTMALHVAYVGAPFRGNTTNPALPRGETVDDVLEDALFAAGHVAVTNYRSPGLGRLSVRRARRKHACFASLVCLRVDMFVSVCASPRACSGAAAAARTRACRRWPRT
jgi:hypothetical protein